MPHPTTTPHPTATPPAPEVQLVTSGLTQGYLNTPRAPLALWMGTTTNASTLNIPEGWLPQVWTTSSTNGLICQAWTSGTTMTITIPAQWGATGTWQYQEPAVALDRPVEQLPEEHGHHMSPIEMGRWLRRREEADAMRAEARHYERARAMEWARQQEECAAAAAAAAEERRREMAEAEARAEALLRSYLSAEQRRDYEQTQSFTVQAPSGRRYRLRRKLSGNVDELGLPGQGVVDRMCIHPYSECPLADVLLCQMLMLRTNEEEFRRTANHRLVA